MRCFIEKQDVYVMQHTLAGYYGVIGSKSRSNGGQQ